MLVGLLIGVLLGAILGGAIVTVVAQARTEGRTATDERSESRISELLTPLREQLDVYSRGVRQLELDRVGAYHGLLERIEQLSVSERRLESETRNLVNALRAPQTRGRWGEVQLRRVVEMAGMLEHCDFDEQVTSDTAEGRLRPDMVVHLPGGRTVVVDSKVPLQSFLEANDATDEEERQEHLAAQARAVRSHVDDLHKKAYWRNFDASPEFVVAFVPGDALLTAAYEHDPHLLEHAIGKHVLLATPVNLIALLRTVAAAWQEDSIASNAREVQLAGRELYRRLATFAEHMARAGRHIAGTVDAYNAAVGSLERSVLSQARRFQDLGVVGGADKEVPELGLIDASPRMPEVREAPPG